MDYRIKGHTPLGVSFTLPLPPTLLNLVPVLREITPGSMLNLLISTELSIMINIQYPSVREDQGVRNISPNSVLEYVFPDELTYIVLYFIVLCFIQFSHPTALLFLASGCLLGSSLLEQNHYILGGLNKVFPLV